MHPKSVHNLFREIVFSIRYMYKIMLIEYIIVLAVITEEPS